MQIVRKPAVAGRFYPSQPEELRKTLQKLIDPTRERQKVIGIVVPHAGYMYSGHVGGAVYSRIAIPSRVIVLFPTTPEWAHHCRSCPGEHGKRHPAILKSMVTWVLH